MHGLGDTIYQRSVVRHFPGAYVMTAWPELFADLDVKCIRTGTRLWYTRRHIESSGFAWARPPLRAKHLDFSYGTKDPEPILAAIARKSGKTPTMDLPDFGASPVKTDKPVAIVRPVTIRREWPNESRAPDPQYVAQAAEILRAKGFHVVSVLMTEDGKEWQVGDVQADEVLHNRPIVEVLAAVQNAALVVGGVGWIVPASLAMRVPSYIILGGALRLNSPQRIASGTDSEHIGWAWPDEPCQCARLDHACAKHITRFGAGFAAWLDRQGISRGGSRARVAA